MRRVRALWRLFLLVKLTVILRLTLLAGYLANPRRRDRRDRWRRRCVRYWARSLLAVMGAEVRCRGTVPEPPFLLVTNHLSYVDVLILGSRVEAVFVARPEVARLPVIGRLCRWKAALFVNRRPGPGLPPATAAIDRALADGEGVVMFPEVTSTRGETVAPFHPALFEGLARSRYPVSCASLAYATAEGDPPAHLSICWWGDVELFGHLWGLLSLPGFSATVTFGDEPIRDGDRDRLADRARRAVEGLFTPTMGEAGPI